MTKTSSLACKKASKQAERKKESSHGKKRTDISYTESAVLLQAV